MAKLTYKLRETTTGKGATIQLVFNYGTKKRLRYSTGRGVYNINNWDSRAMKVKNTPQELDKDETNFILNELRTKLERGYFTISNQNKGAVNNHDLKIICDEVCNRATVTKRNKDNEPKELLPFFEWYIEYFKTRPLITTGRPMAKGTAKTYSNTLEKLKEFNDTVYPLTYDKITLDFHQDFLDYCYENNYSLNYIGTLIKVLKTIMNTSFEMGYHTSMDYTKRYFKKPNEEVYNIYLTNDELKDIENLNLENTPTYIANNTIRLTAEKLDLARDLLLIASNTGLRVSNFNQLTSKNIIQKNGKQYFDVIAKGNKNVVIPINHTVKKVLKKYGDNPPPSLPEQHLNYAFKRIGKLAKINNDETKTLTKGGKKVIINKKKYEMIGTHTCRRSFCTNAYLSGMPVSDIMVASGHSTEKVFYNYIKVGAIGKAEKISTNKFFSDTHLMIS